MSSWVWFGGSFAVEMDLVPLWARNATGNSHVLCGTGTERRWPRRDPLDVALCGGQGTVGVTVFHMIMRPQLGKVGLCLWDW